MHRSVFAIATLLAGVAGTVLRLWGLPRQVLIGDELHTLNGMLSRSVGEILRQWTYYGADYCVPLTAFFRLLADRGLEIDEMTLRVPSLIAGCAIIVCLPLALRGRIGQAAAARLAWLLAIAPLLVLYARIVRSYAIATLLTLLAVLAFERWWRTRERRFAVAWALLSPLAVWFHLVVGFLVATPFVLAALAWLRGGRDRRLGFELAATGAVAAALLAAMLLPSLDSILALTRTHRIGGVPAGPAVWEVTRMHSGTLWPAVSVLIAAVAMRGAFLLWQRDARLVGLLAALAVGHGIGLALMAPDQLQHSWVLSRYLLPLLPFELALVALGLELPRAWGARVAAPLAGAAFAALLGLWFASGPLAQERYRTSSFVHSIPSVSFVSEGNWISAEGLPPFYQRLAQSPGGAPLIEFPWHNIASHAYEAYQHHHQRPVLLGSVDSAHTQSGTALRNLVAAGPHAFLASPARYAVIHLDVQLEESLVPTSDGHHWRRLHEVESVWKHLADAGRRLDDVLTRNWGEPHYSDSSMRVWDLDALRARQRRS